MLTLSILTVLAPFVHFHFGPDEKKELEVGDAMPAISAGGWLNTPGELSLRTEDVNGAVILIDFWATWSTDARKRAPALNKLQKRFHNDQLIILAMTDESKAKVSSFVTTQKVIYIIGYDSKGMRDAFRVSILPRLMVFDAAGKLVYKGNSIDEAEKAVDKTLKEKPPTAKGSLAARLGQTALENADKLRKQKKNVEAFKLYERLVKQRGSDDAVGRKAARALDELKADKKVMREVYLADAKAKCEGWLRMARDLAKSGKADGARKYYQRIIDEFGDTAYAETARKELAALE